jgi:prolyl oligopeptidase
MRHLRVRRLVLPAAVLLAALPCAGAPPDRPPETRADPVRETIHGVEIADPYRWLEDQNSPETRAWIDTQNAYTRETLAQVPGRADIEKRAAELLRVDATSTPRVADGRYFFSRRTAGQDLPILYVRRGAQGKDQVLVDPHPLSADHSVSVSLLDVARDARLVAYGVRQGGEDEVVVKLLQVDNRRELKDSLPKARYSGVVISRDRRKLFYSKQTKEGPRVFFHTMGTPATSDIQLFGDGYGPEKIISTGLSDDGRYLVLVVFHGSAARKTEVYFQDLVRGDPIQPVVNDLDARFFPTVGGDRMFLQTNWNAPNGRVLAVELARPARENWKEIVPAGDFAIQDTAAAGERLFVRTLENVVPKIRIFDRDGKRLGQIEMSDLGTVSNVSGDWASREAFFTFQSYVVPSTIFRYDIGSGDRAVWAKPQVPFDGSNYAVEQVRFPSKDGTSVPMFLVHRKNAPRDGSNPTLLTGYGGFTVSLLPVFSARAALWVERGGVWAVANLRGGNEFGEDWHKAGMLEKKQNVFDDFLGAAEWLIAQKWTSREKLAISGGSNGGLLVGAALTQRPDLFQAVVCSYPLLDMVRYHKFLVAGYWVPEYGSSEDSGQFGYLHEYSPYHRVKPGTAYPAVLFITGDADTRVAPLHARKMTALLQADSSDQAERPILLDYDTKAGHSRGFNTPVTKQIEDLTTEFLFLKKVGL